MDRTIRRALYTALVAGGLVVVGASPAYAMVEGLSDSVANGETDAADAAAPAGDAADLADSLVGQHGVLDSLMHADVGAVVEGTLGEHGVLDRLLVSGPPTDIETPVPDGPQPQDPVANDPVSNDPVSNNPVSNDPPAAEPVPDVADGIIPGIIGPGREPADRPEAGAPRTDRPGTDRQGTDHKGTGRQGSGDHGSDRPAAAPEQAASGDADGGRLGIAALSLGGSRLPAVGSGVPGLDRPVSARADAADRSTTAADPADDVSATGVDLSWGGRADVVPTSADATADDLADPVYDGNILMSGLYDGIRGTSTGPDGQAQTERSDATLAQTGPTITGHLALVSLLMGLGIAVLRIRRRPLVV